MKTYWLILYFCQQIPINPIHFTFLHHASTCLSFSRSAWYEQMTDGSLGWAVRRGGVLPDLLHPPLPLPPPPLPLLFLGLAHSLLSFTPDTQLVSFLTGVLSDFFTLTTDSMMLRSSQDGGEWSRRYFSDRWCVRIEQFSPSLMLCFSERTKSDTHTHCVTPGGGNNSGGDGTRTRTAFRQGSDTLT